MAEIDSTTTEISDNPAWLAIADCADSLMRADSVLSALVSYTDPTCETDVSRPRQLYSVFLDEVAEADSALHRFHGVAQEIPASAGDFDWKKFRAAELALIAPKGYLNVLSAFDWLDSDKACDADFVLRILLRRFHKKAQAICISFYPAQGGGAQV